MIGISSSGKESISKVVEEIFDRIALHFIGDIPGLKNAKKLVISTEPNFGLSHLFIQAMNNRQPNAIERDVLKSLLGSSNGYISSLKSKTGSNITERIDGIVKEAKAQNRIASEEEIQSVLDDEFKRAESHLKAVIESESTKLRNLGTMIDISKAASSIGDSDPTIFFAMVRDASTCKECIRLHLMPDQVTPRLWKFSELKQGYHKRGETNPSAFGLHPHCRCTIAYLTPSFGFKNGKLKYISENYDAYKEQRAA